MPALAPVVALDPCRGSACGAQHACPWGTGRLAAGLRQATSGRAQWGGCGCATRYATVYTSRAPPPPGALCTGMLGADICLRDALTRRFRDRQASALAHRWPRGPAAVTAAAAPGPGVAGWRLTNAGTLERDARYTQGWPARAVANLVSWALLCRRPVSPTSFSSVPLTWADRQLVTQLPERSSWWWRRTLSWRTCVG